MLILIEFILLIWIISYIVCKVIIGELRFGLYDFLLFLFSPMMLTVDTIDYILEHKQ